ncbi:hypothetical protein A5784_20860 [Mycobacterium sp. 852013-50091_SCH5140682]|nr:response regulator [Mycobacterium sp. 852013-50091_SCH5140682]OBC00290.1 hypothetical protein A5784_20860 [Mycobacterium sp. 852013-50091_SCH5140682]
MKVLIVEDEPLLAGSLAKGLGAEGFAVALAATGPNGLRQATANSFDAVILDIMLPGLSGYQVLEHLRAHQVWTPAVTSWDMGVPK